MKIYHYTTIDSLALILKSRKFRFTRLDHVDDLEEARVEQDQYDFSGFLFVSCWTESGEESIPQWKLYSDPIRGVRIGIEKEMFSGYFSFVFDDQTGELKNVSHSLIPEDKKNDFFVLPAFDSNEAPFYRKVEYVEDLALATKDLIHKENQVKRVFADGSRLLDVSLNLNMNQLGAIKHKRWSFQEECRFSLFIVPGNPYVRNIDTAISIMLSSLSSKRFVPFTFYDLSLCSTFFQSLEITLAPNAAESQRVIVESLCAAYAPEAIIKNSSLSGKVSFK